MGVRHAVVRTPGRAHGYDCVVCVHASGAYGGVYQEIVVGGEWSAQREWCAAHTVRAGTASCTPLVHTVCHIAGSVSPVQLHDGVARGKRVHVYGAACARDDGVSNAVRAFGAVHVWTVGRASSPVRAHTAVRYVHNQMRRRTYSQRRLCPPRLCPALFPPSLPHSVVEVQVMWRVLLPSPSNAGARFRGVVLRIGPGGVLMALRWHIRNLVGS